MSKKIDWRFFPPRNNFYPPHHKSEIIMNTTTTETAIKITKAQDWNPDPSKFDFMDKPYTSPQGGLTIGYRYDGTKLRIKTPKFRCPFGLQQGMNGVGFNLQLNFDDSEAGKAFLAACEKFDKIILEAGQKNSDKWLGKNKNGKSYTKEVVHEKFTPMVKYRRNKETKEIMTDVPPSFKVKLPSKTLIVDDPSGNHPDSKDGKVKQEQFQCRLFDKNKKEIDITSENLPAGCYCSLLMSASSIWSTSTGFGATWKAEQIMVFTSDNQLPDMCLLEEDGDDVESGGEAAPSTQQQSTQPQSTQQTVQDAGEEEEEEVEEEEEEVEEAPAPVPAPAPVQVAPKRQTAPKKAKA